MWVICRPTTRSSWRPPRRGSRCLPPVATPVPMTRFASSARAPPRIPSAAPLTVDSPGLRPVHHRRRRHHGTGAVHQQRRRRRAVDRQGARLGLGLPAAVRVQQGRRVLGRRRRRRQRLLAQAAVPVLHPRHSAQREEAVAGLQRSGHRPLHVPEAARPILPGAMCRTSRSTPIRKPATCWSPAAACYSSGGTSFVSPQFNGISALLRQSTGHRIGLWNPHIYLLQNLFGYGKWSAFNRVNAGNNWFYEGDAGLQPGLGHRHAQRRQPGPVHALAASEPGLTGPPRGGPVTTLAGSRRQCHRPAIDSCRNRHAPPPSLHAARRILQPACCWAIRWPW